MVNDDELLAYINLIREYSFTLKNPYDYFEKIYKFCPDKFDVDCLINNKGDNYLICAIKNNDICKIKELKERFPFLDFNGFLFSRSCLFEAIKTKNIEILKEILENDYLNVNVYDNKQRETALHYSIRLGFDKATLVLIKFGASLLTSSHKWCNILMLSIHYKRRKLIDFFLTNHEYMIYLKDADGANALDHAIYFDDLKTLKQLILMNCPFTKNSFYCFQKTKINWEKQRLFFIAILKEQNPNICPLSLLPTELIYYIFNSYIYSPFPLKQFIEENKLIINY